MLRLLFGMFVAVTVARWFYAETKIIAPSVVPYLDKVLSVAQIPTHDKWEKKDFELFVAGLDQEVAGAAASVSQNAPSSVTRTATQATADFMPVYAIPTRQNQFEWF